MQIPRFDMERWQSIWEHRLELNISESGVLPMTTEELLADPDELQRLMDVPLIYPPTQGGEELRAGIASMYNGASAGNVLATTGCAEANFLTVMSLLEPGDEVVCMQPNYMQVPGMARALGATVKPLWLREELRWAPDLDELQRLLTPRTKLVAICNPNNPTGAVLGEEALERICAEAARVGAWVLADEVYRGAEFDGAMTPSFWGRYERVLCTGGLSKAYGLPGLRTGWVVAPEKMVEKLWSNKDYTTIGATLLSDRLAAAALEPARRARIFERTRRILRQNYPVVRDWVKRHGAGLRHIAPAAGAIAWVGYEWKRPSAELAEEMRAHKGVLIVPGMQFEMESYLRIGFGYDAGHLERALGRLDEMTAVAASA